MKRILRFLRGVRTRTALVAAIVVVLALVVTIPLLGLAANNRVESAIDRQLRDRAAAMAPLVEAGLAADAVRGAAPDVFAQVLDPAGVPVAVTPGLESLGRFAPLAPPAGVFEAVEVDSLIEALESRLGLEDEGPYRIVALGVATPEGTWAVQVATSLDAARTVLRVVASIVIYGAPLLALAVGVLVWFLSGRSLRPVEAIRAEAEEITASNLSRRVPVALTADEIQHLAETINEMLARLDEAAGRQRRFVSDASHELKSPVAAMRTMLEVSGAEVDETAGRVVAADLLAEVARLETLIAELLELARADEGDPQARWAEVDLDQIAGREADALARRSELQVDTSQIEAARVRGSATRLQTAVRNLLDNAALHASSALEVVVHTEGSAAVLVVADDGSGIAEADRERVFDRFYTADPARSRTGGSGLGLAVVRSVARAHGGEATVVASPLGGAAIEMRLPAAG